MHLWAWPGILNCVIVLAQLQQKPIAFVASFLKCYRAFVPLQISADARRRLPDLHSSGRSLHHCSHCSEKIWSLFSPHLFSRYGQDIWTRVSCFKQPWFTDTCFRCHGRVASLVLAFGIDLWARLSTQFRKILSEVVLCRHSFFVPKFQSQ